VTEIGADQFNSMFRSMVAGTMAAATVGLGAAMISSVIFGTAGIPFVIGSSLGFILGSWRWYATATSQAMASLDQYPALLRLHLLANFPSSALLRTRPLEQFNSAAFRGGWELKSMLVAGWLSAGPSLEAIQTQAEATLVEEYAKDTAEVNSEVKRLTINAS
jgi:hypothetical protein